ncbi:hypothetical protein JD969_15580 [Planctomycetota bacterium]|nr:hypothetical protein JD969_15580 [Planctomycetota bacterium]
MHTFKLSLITLSLALILPACSGESSQDDNQAAAQNASPDFSQNTQMSDSASNPAASPPNAEQYPEPPAAGSPSLPPDKRAQMASEVLDVMLSLEPIQTEQVYVIFLQSAKRTDEIFDTLPKDQWPQAFRDMQQQKNVSLKATLTPQQYETYLKNRSALDPYLRFTE